MMHHKKKRKSYRIAIIAVVLLLIAGFAWMYAGKDDTGLQICPDEMIVNQMPGPDRSGESDENVEAARSSYYILEGERKEVTEFDSEWLAENCYISVQQVY